MPSKFVNTVEMREPHTPIQTIDAGSDMTTATVLTSNLIEMVEVQDLNAEDS